MFSSVKDVSNLFGKAVDRYRTEYKNMNFVRRVFFENITGSLDFDRFTEYFKWKLKYWWFFRSRPWEVLREDNKILSYRWFVVYVTSPYRTILVISFLLINCSSVQAALSVQRQWPSSCDVALPHLQFWPNWEQWTLLRRKSRFHEGPLFYISWFIGPSGWAKERVIGGNRGRWPVGLAKDWESPGFIRIFV